jgi:CRISPR/Cas system Type II protein with McrA/HNH and RuvC-like nuclease domain
MAIHKPIKVSFNGELEYDNTIYNFIKSKKNGSAFIKELVLNSMLEEGIITEEESLDIRYKANLNTNDINRVGSEFHEIESINKSVILHNQNGLCKYCGKSITVYDKRLDSHWHLDHIYPLSLGGLTAAFNVQILCSTCNMSKGNNLSKTPKDHIELCESNNLLWNRVFYKKNITKDEIVTIKNHIRNFLKSKKLDYNSLYITLTN